MARQVTIKHTNDERSVTQQKPYSLTICLTTPTLNDCGLTHALEHLVLRRNIQYPAPESLFQLKVLYDIDIQASTLNNGTFFYCSSSNFAHFQLAVNYLIHAINYPLLEEEDIKNEIVNEHGRGVVYKELGIFEKNPCIQQWYRYLYAQSIFKNHGGYQHLLPRITLLELVNYHACYYLNNPVTLLFKGAIHENYRNQIGRFFSKSSYRGKPFVPSAQKSQHLNFEKLQPETCKGLLWWFDHALYGFFSDNIRQLDQYFTNDKIKFFLMPYALCKMEQFALLIESPNGHSMKLIEKVKLFVTDAFEKYQYNHCNKINVCKPKWLFETQKSLKNISKTSPEVLSVCLNKAPVAVEKVNYHSKGDITKKSEVSADIGSSFISDYTFSNLILEEDIKSINSLRKAPLFDELSFIWIENGSPFRTKHYLEQVLPGYYAVLDNYLVTHHTAEKIEEILQDKCCSLYTNASDLPNVLLPTLIDCKVNMQFEYQIGDKFDLKEKADYSLDTNPKYYFSDGLYHVLMLRVDIPLVMQFTIAFLFNAYPPYLQGRIAGFCYHIEAKYCHFYQSIVFYSVGEGGGKCWQDFFNRVLSQLAEDKYYIDAVLPKLKRKLLEQYAVPETLIEQLNLYSEADRYLDTVLTNNKIVNMTSIDLIDILKQIIIKNTDKVNVI